MSIPPSDFGSMITSQSDLTFGPELPVIATDFFILPDIGNVIQTY
jgi:hypothetical protein